MGSNYFLFFAVLLLLLPTALSVQAVPPDTTPPTIDSPSITPASPRPEDKVIVWASVTDAGSGVKNVSTTYTTDSWKTSTTVLDAYNATSYAATVQLPAQQYGGQVAYYIVAFDNAGNKGVNNNSGSYFAYVVPAPPAVTAVPDRSTAAIGETVTVTITATDPDGTVASVNVNWGDGNTDTFNGPTTTRTHKYESAGTYTVTVTATDDSGLSTTATSTLTISQPTVAGPVLAVAVAAVAGVAGLGVLAYRRRSRKPLTSTQP